MLLHFIDPANVWYKRNFVISPHVLVVKMYSHLWISRSSRWKNSHKRKATLGPEKVVYFLRRCYEENTSCAGPIRSLETSKRFLLKSIKISLLKYDCHQNTFLMIRQIDQRGICIFVVMWPNCHDNIHFKPVIVLDLGFRKRVTSPLYKRNCCMND